ncbi:MAG TPA: hypothetical protein DEB24_02710 [Coriobacteriia bacterium]|nr:hypothetical protein [Coriobacteriia bacterium]
MVYQSIEKYLRESNIDRALFAKQALLTEEALTQILEGKRNISIEEYLEIVRTLCLPLDYFSPVQDDGGLYS